MVLNGDVVYMQRLWAGWLAEQDLLVCYRLIYDALHSNTHTEKEEGGAQGFEVR